MAISLTTPITGGAQTNFTSPAWTIASAQAPDGNAKMWLVTGGTGTIVNVRFHSVSDPFSLTAWQPKSPKTLMSPNPVTGRYGSVGSNEYSLVCRKGVQYAANQSPLTAVGVVKFSIPAGSDAYDAPNVRALVSALVGAANQQSAGIGDTCVNGSL